MHPLLLCVRVFPNSQIELTSPFNCYSKPTPLNTVELQKMASNKLKMGSERVMQVAEELYQRGFLSYPRTETEVYQPGTELRQFVSEQTASAQWGAYAQG